MRITIYSTYKWSTQGDFIPFWKTVASWVIGARRYNTYQSGDQVFSEILKQIKKKTWNIHIFMDCQSMTTLWKKGVTQ